MVPTSRDVTRAVAPVFPEELELWQFTGEAAHPVGTPATLRPTRGRTAAEALNVRCADSDPASTPTTPRVFLHELVAEA